MAKSPLAKWDILRDDYTLRGLIKSRMGEQGLSRKALAEKTGVSYDQIKNYLAGGYKWKGINQYNLVKIANELGIEVSLKIVLKW